MLYSHSNQLNSSLSQKSLFYSSNSINKPNSKFTSFPNNINQQRTSQISPSLLLKSKFAKFNNQLLLPRCLQKSLNKKFILSPLAQTNQKSQSAFKLKNYFKLQQRSFDQPIFTDQQQLKHDPPNNQNQFHQMRLTFLKQNSSQQENKENMTYQNQLAQMMITQSKFKYSPRDTLRITKSKWTHQSMKNTDINEQKVENSFLSRTNSMMNFSKYSFEGRRISSSKQPKNLLNSTRTKLLCQMQKIPIQQITKKDIFPLEKLMEKRAYKTSFRNKWFAAKSLQNEIIQE